MIATSLQAIKPFVKFDAAIPAAWWWDARVNRYRSFVSGQFVSLRTVYDILETVEAGSMEVMSNLSISLLNEEIGMSEWYLTMRRYLTRMHVQNAALGAGGYDQLTQEDLWRIDSMLKEDAPRLYRFGQQIEAGQLSEAQIRNRVRMYAGYARIQYFRAQQPPLVGEDEVAIERRKLNPAEHCSYCIYLEELGWQLFGTLPVPGESDPNWPGDQCYTNCRCDLIREVVDRPTAATRMGRDTKAWVADSFLFRELGKAIFDWDESLHPRWPEGTPVDPFSGEGGGRFMTKPEAEKEAVAERGRRESQQAEGGKQVLNKDFAANFISHRSTIQTAVGNETNPERQKWLKRQSAIVVAGLADRVDPEFVSWANGIVPGVFDKPAGKKRSKPRIGTPGNYYKPRQPRQPKAAPEQEKSDDKPEKKEKEPKNVDLGRFMTIRQGMSWLRRNHPNFGAMLEMFRMETGFVGFNANMTIPWADERGVDYSGMMEFQLKNGNGVIIDWNTTDNGGITIDHFVAEDENDSVAIMGGIKKMADKGGAPIKINDVDLLNAFKDQGWITDGNVYKPKGVGKIIPKPRPAPKEEKNLLPRPRPTLKSVKAGNNHWEGVLRDERGRWKDTPGRGKQETVIAYTFWPNRPTYITRQRRGELADTEHFGIKRADIDDILAPMFKKYDLDGKVTVQLDGYDDLRIDTQAYWGEDQVGLFSFTLRKLVGTEKLEATINHVEIAMDRPEMTGAGMMFVRGLVKKLKGLGFDSVRLRANISIGTYAWAKVGFKYEPYIPNQQAVYGNVSSRSFKRWAEKKGISEHIGEWPYFDEPEDWAIFDVPDAPRIKGSQIRNKDVPESMSMPIGKAFMLDHDGHGPWDGILYLKDDLPKLLAKAAKYREWEIYTPARSMPVYVLISQSGIDGVTDIPFWEEIIKAKYDVVSPNKAAPKDISHVWRDERGRWTDTPGIGDDAPKEHPEEQPKSDKQRIIEENRRRLEEIRRQGPPPLIAPGAKIDPFDRRYAFELIAKDPRNFTLEMAGDYWRVFEEDLRDFDERGFLRRLSDNHYRLGVMMEAVMKEQAKVNGWSFQEAIDAYASVDLPRDHYQGYWADMYPKDFDDEMLANALPNMARSVLDTYLGDDARFASSMNRYEKTAGGSPTLDGWVLYTRYVDPDWVTPTADWKALKKARERGYDLRGRSGENELVNALQFMMDDSSRDMTEQGSPLYKRLEAAPLFLGDWLRAHGRRGDYMTHGLADIAKDAGLTYGQYRGALQSALETEEPLPLIAMYEGSSKLGGFGASDAASMLFGSSHLLSTKVLNDRHKVTQEMFDALEHVTIEDIVGSYKSHAGTLYLSDTTAHYIQEAWLRASFDSLDDAMETIGTTHKWGNIALATYLDHKQVAKTLEGFEDISLSDVIEYSWFASSKRPGDEYGAVFSADFMQRVLGDSGWLGVNKALRDTGVGIEDLHPDTAYRIVENLGADGISENAAEILIDKHGEFFRTKSLLSAADQLKPLGESLPVYDVLADKSESYKATGVSMVTGEEVRANTYLAGSYRQKFFSGLHGEHITKKQRELESVHGQASAQKDIIVSELSDELEEDYALTNEFIAQWAISSNGGDMRSLGIQEVAAEVFTADLSKWQREEISRLQDQAGSFDPANYDPDDDDQFHPAMMDDIADRDYIRDALLAMHGKTERWFKEAEDVLPKGAITESSGDKYIKLYRGVRLSYADLDYLEPEVGEDIQIDDNALSSWSLSKQTARSFAGAGDGRIGLVLSAQVPIDRVLSNARTGFGCLGEEEFVVIGIRGKAYARVEEKRGAIPAGKAAGKTAPKDISHVWRDERGRWTDTPGIGDDAPEEHSKEQPKSDSAAEWDRITEGLKNPPPLITPGMEIDLAKITFEDIAEDPRNFTLGMAREYWDKFEWSMTELGFDDYRLYRRGYLDRLGGMMKEVVAEQAKVNGWSFQEAVEAYGEANISPYHDQSFWATLFPMEFDDEVLAAAHPEITRENLYEYLDDIAKRVSSANRYEDTLYGQPPTLDGWVKYTKLQDKGWLWITGDTENLKQAMDRGYKISSDTVGGTGLQNSLAFLLDDNDEHYDPSSQETPYTARDLGGRLLLDWPKKENHQDLADVLSRAAAYDGMTYSLYRDTVSKAMGNNSLPIGLMAAGSARLGGFGTEDAADLLISHTGSLRPSMLSDQRYFTEEMISQLEKVKASEIVEVQRRKGITARPLRDAVWVYIDGAWENEDPKTMKEIDSLVYLSDGDDALVSTLYLNLDRRLLGDSIDGTGDATLADMLKYSKLVQSTYSYRRGAEGDPARMFTNGFIDDRLAGYEWEDVRDAMDAYDVRLDQLDAHTAFRIIDKMGVDGVKPYEAFAVLEEHYDYMRLADTSSDGVYTDLDLKADKYKRSGVDAYTGEGKETNRFLQDAYDDQYRVGLYGEEDERTKGLKDDAAQKHVIARDMGQAIYDNWPKDEYGEFPIDEKRGYSFANELVHQWAQTSNGGDMRSLSVQEEAARLFGSELSEWQKELVVEAKNFAGGFYDDSARPLHHKFFGDEGAREYIRQGLLAMKKKTEKWFEDAESFLPENAIVEQDGKKYIRLYRGVKLDESVVEQLGAREGEILRYDDNALSSWSISRRVAESFSSAYSGKPGILLSALIPIDKVLCNARTGFGCLDEDEFVVIGVKGEAYARVEQITKTSL